MLKGENVELSRTIEQEIKDLVTQIPQQINDIRNNSTRIEQIFDGVQTLNSKFRNRFSKFL